MPFPVLRPRQPFVGLALAAIAGIVVADRWPAPLWMVGLALVPAVALFWWRPRSYGAWIFAAIAFFGLHTWRFQGSTAREIAGELTAGPRVVHATGIVWDEPQPPQFFTPGLKCFFRLKLESIDLAGASRGEGVLMNVRWAGDPPRYGDRIVLTGSARNTQPTRNPGQFDFTRYLQRQGVYSEIEVRFASDGRFESGGHGWALQAFAFESRRWIQKQLEVDLEHSPDLTALIESMVLGLRGDTPEDARELFQRTGTMHLFAVSGLNVAMLAGIALSLLRALRFSSTAAVVVTIPLLAFYALVTGLPASCVRAAIMAALILLGPVFDRRPLVLNSISAAAFLILVWDTNQFFAPGFQFSFVLVLVIVGLAQRIERWFLPFGSPDPFLPRLLWDRGQRVRTWVWRGIAGTLGVTLSAWLGSLLFTAGYFHLFSLAAIVANLVAVPIAFAILAIGVAALLVAPVWKTGLVLLNNANWAMAKLLLTVLKWFAMIPGGHLYVELPDLHPKPVCEITVLDLQDGAAAHLRADKADWLIDCGSTFTYGHTVLPYLRSRGVNQLNGLLLTHGDAHHIGGTISALDDFQPRELGDSALQDRSSTRDAIFARLVALRRGKAIFARGDMIRIAPETSARILFPPPGLKRAVADDKALVVQLTAAGTRVLFMSDSGFGTEQWLLENEPDLRSDIVIKGHHTRDFSGTPDFLARVQPQAIICGQLEATQDPATLDEWEAAATAMGITVFRQDRTGAVHTELREGGEFELRAFLGGQILRSRAR